MSGAVVVPKRLSVLRGGVALVALLLGSGIAASADDDEMRRCRQLTEVAQRLACYDGIELAAPGTARQPGGGASGFGVVRGGGAEIESIESLLVQAIDGWGPNQVISLANGQRWQITDGSSGFMRAAVRKVKVRRGALGAFYIEFEGINGSPRVKRIE